MELIVNRPVNLETGKSVFCRSGRKPWESSKEN